MCEECSVCLPERGVIEVMIGTGQFSPSITKGETEHSSVTSQLSAHHPQVNPDPRVATHAEQPSASARQSYNVTVCVCQCVCGRISV